MNNTLAKDLMTPTGFFEMYPAERIVSERKKSGKVWCSGFFSETIPKHLLRFASLFDKVEVGGGRG